jgi:hypothetical protein
MPLELSSRDFAECVRTAFEIEATAAERVKLELTGVTEQTYSPELETFTLTFSGPSSPFLPQRSYRVCHEKLGALDLFLVPLGPDAKGMQYEAVFNRFLRDRK